MFVGPRQISMKLRSVLALLANIINASTAITQQYHRNHNLSRCLRDFVTRSDRNFGGELAGSPARPPSQPQPRNTTYTTAFIW